MRLSPRSASLGQTSLTQKVTCLSHQSVAHAVPGQDPQEHRGPVKDGDTHTYTHTHHTHARTHTRTCPQARPTLTLTLTHRTLPKPRALQTTTAFILLQSKAGVRAVHSQAVSEGAEYWGHVDWTPK